MQQQSSYQLLLLKPEVVGCVGNKPASH